MFVAARSRARIGVPGCRPLAETRHIPSTGLTLRQASNFQLRASDDEVGTKAIKRMRAGSIFFVLLESERTNAAFPHPRL